MQAPSHHHDAEPAVLLFDGVCNLCSGVVRWVIAHDPQHRVVFGALQSDRGRQLRRAYGIADDVDSLVLIHRGEAHVRSGAALRLAGLLTPPWSWARIGLVIPAPLRDAAYRFIAGHRYRWFGRQDECWLPTPQLRARFLPDEPSAP